ncbi:MAG: Stk1 family PASTA domain-containing Ser/Thr kinase [Nitriliruptor sp.]|nr:MAG: Stk1 family PASTA domain-containing Ser/Thr kinase [Nitriliruptor sp.]
MPEPPSAPTAPTRVGGRYTLLDELGRGGMASVYRARDEVLDRQVAVKLLHPHLATDTAFLDRFRREARAAAALSHPNVVGVHDWGETDDGAYLVLQLVEGPTLRQLLRQRGQLTPEEAAGIMIPAARGLGAAHDAGLIHRDVKPENLLLGQDGTVRVTDFGLARAVASSTSTFGTDVLVGSPHYLSPEAVSGERLDPRADVYALGVVLFECLTGHPPHNGESAFATAVQHTSHAVPAPSTVVDGIEPGVDDVVRWATAIDRGTRYPTGDDFARALSNAVPSPTPSIGLAAEAATARPWHVGAPGERGESGLAGHRLFTDADGPDARDADDADDADDATDHHDFDWDDVGDGIALATGPGTSILRPDEGDDTDGDTANVGPTRRRSGWMVAFVIVALIVASGVGGYLFWDRVMAPVLAVPSVVGAELAAAEEQLVEQGFVPEVVSTRHDAQTPIGNVLEQDPTGEARRGTQVDLVLSDGPRQVEVPDVTGEPFEDAVAVLEAAGFRTADEQVFDESVAAGTVIASDPPADEVLDEASLVTLTVSQGPRPIEVPDVTGDTLEAADDTLQELNLEVEATDRRFDDGVPADRIIEQSPSAGSTLFRGDTVEVVVSDGPRPIEVPSVRDQSVAEAVAILEELGFEVDVDRRGGLGALLRPGQVFDQDPGPGRTRFAGDVITLFAYND